MKTLKNKNIVRLLILISLIVVVGLSFIVTTAVYKGTHIGSGSLVLDKGIYIDISDVSSGELSKNMEMPIQYYLDKVTSETNRIQFSVKPSSEAEYYIANPTITAQDSSQAFYLRLKLNAQYYVNGSSTPTTFSMSASEKNTLFQLFATDSNYSPVLFNDCFAADANGEYYYYVSGGYGVATKNNLAQVTSGMEISLFKGFLANGTTPVSVINFREFEKVPENVTNITLSLDIELAIEPNNWNLPDVTLLTENDVTVSLVDNEYEITKINTSATSYALPGYYQGNAITRIGTTSPSALDDDAITVWFANTMTHVGGYRGVSTLQRIYLGNNVSEICDSAFGYSGLTGNLVLPISIQKIGKESLGDLNTTGLFPYIPNCMTYGLGAFKNDAGFTGTLTIRGEIYEHAFKDMSGIDTSKISSGTTLLENDPHSDNFAGMSSLKKVFIDSSAVAGLASSSSGLLENENLTDVYIKSDLTIGAYFANHSNFVETESNVAGYRHFGRSYQLTFNGGNIDGTLDAKLWNYAGSAGYSSSNSGNNGKYTFSGKNATTRIGINGVNTFYLPMPIISGYTFDGWYTTANGVGEGVKVATADGWIANVSGYTSENGSWIRASETTLYAHYTKKEYSISYDFAGGSKGTNAPSSYIFGNTTAISNPTRKGYLFTGWNISVSLTGKSFATIDINTGVQEYVASYPNAVYYELFYAHQGISYTAALSGGQIRWRGYTTAGAYSSSLSSSSNYTSSTDGYVALWYHLGKEDNNTTYTYNYTGDNLSIDSLQVGNLTLTAKWTPITYTIQYNGNGNTGGSTANSSHTYDQAKDLTANGFTKTGYTFVGWTKNKLSGAYACLYQYLDKESVKNLSTTNNENVVLYALWRHNSSYLNRSWATILSNNSCAKTNIKTITFTNTLPSGSGYRIVSVGATSDIGGAWSSGYAVFDVKAYIKQNSSDSSKYDVYFYSPVTIFAPQNSNSLFSRLTNVVSIVFNNFNTSTISGGGHMDYMFSQCSALTSLDLTSFNTSNATDMNSLFSGCSLLNSVKLTSFNTSKVKYVNYLFNGCSSLQSLDLSNFDFSSIIEATDFFKGCSALTTIKTPKAISSGITIDLPSTANKHWSNQSNASQIYVNISSSNINMTLVRKNNSSYLLTGTNWQQALINANSNYTQANILNITFTNILPTQGTSVSVGATTSAGTTKFSSSTLGVSDIIAYVTASSVSGKYDVVFYSPVIIYAPADSSWLFSSTTTSKQLTNLKSITFDNFNTINVTNMKFMFLYCSSLSKLTLTMFQTTNVANMSGIFSNCTSLTSVDISSFTTSKVTDMSSMFSNCSSLTSLNVSNLDTRNVYNMSSMFSKCSSLTSLNVSKFNMTKVTYIGSMFSDCSKLTTIDLSNFDLSVVNTTSSCFSGCTSLKTIKTPKKINSGYSLPLPYLEGRWYNGSSGPLFNITSSMTSTTVTLNNSFTLYNIGNYALLERTSSKLGGSIGVLTGITITIYWGDVIQIISNAGKVTLNSHSYNKYAYIKCNYFETSTANTAVDSEMKNQENGLTAGTFTVYGDITITSALQEEYRLVWSGSTSTGWIRNGSASISSSSWETKAYDMISSGYKYKVSGKVTFGIKSNQSGSNSFTQVSSWSGSTVHASWRADWSISLSTGGVSFTGSSMGLYWGKGYITEVYVYY